MEMEMPYQSMMYSMELFWIAFFFLKTKAIWILEAVFTLNISIEPNIINESSEWDQQGWEGKGHYLGEKEIRNQA